MPPTKSQALLLPLTSLVCFEKEEKSKNPPQKKEGRKGVLTFVNRTLKIKPLLLLKSEVARTFSQTKKTNVEIIL